MKTFLLGLVVTVVLASIIEFLVFPGPLMLNSDNVRHCMYSEALRHGFVKSAGIPYVLFHIIPWLCDDLALRVSSVITATLFYVLSWLVFRDVIRALFIVFFAEPIWPVVLYDPLLGLSLWNKLALQPGRTWIWFRPWSLSLLLLLLYMYMYERERESRVIALGLAYQFHPPMAFFFVVLETLYAEPWIGVLAVAANLLIVLVSFPWFKLNLIVLTMLLIVIVLREKIRRITDKLDYNKLVTIYAAIMPLSKLLWVGLPIGRYLPLIYLTSKMENKKIMLLLLVASIPSWMGYLHFLQLKA